MSPEKKLDILYDHYKDSFQVQLRYIDNRNRYFWSALTLLGIQMLFIASPDSQTTMANEIVKKYLSDKATFAPYYLNSLIWFSLLWTLSLYYRSLLTISRQYKYISQVEKSLTELLETHAIQRESFPLKPNSTEGLIQGLYKILFPVLILCTTTRSIFNPLQNQPGLYNAFDLMMQGLILILTLFQLWNTFVKPKPSHS